ncbi:MAG: hypothetical protein KDD70_10340 [Bdellovibrionales bacterium]|nr:hypothetical protein [Bdellovibrionales bacterium]
MRNLKLNIHPHYLVSACAVVASLFFTTSAFAGPGDQLYVRQDTNNTDSYFGQGSAHFPASPSSSGSILLTCAPTASNRGSIYRTTGNSTAATTAGAIVETSPFLGAACADMAAIDDEWVAVSDPLVPSTGGSTNWGTVYVGKAAQVGNSPGFFSTTGSTSTTTITGDAIPDPNSPSQFIQVEQLGTFVKAFRYLEPNHSAPTDFLLVGAKNKAVLFEITAPGVTTPAQRSFITRRVLTAPFPDGGTNNFFGFAATVGDLNMDGKIDAVITDPFFDQFDAPSNSPVSDAGAAFFFDDVTTPRTAAQLQTPLDSSFTNAPANYAAISRSGAHLGWSVASFKTPNGAGVLLGAPQWGSSTEPNSGGAMFFRYDSSAPTYYTFLKQEFYGASALNSYAGFGVEMLANTTSSTDTIDAIISGPGNGGVFSATNGVHGSVASIRIGGITNKTAASSYTYLPGMGNGKAAPVHFDAARGVGRTVQVLTNGFGGSSTANIFYPTNILAAASNFNWQTAISGHLVNAQKHSIVLNAGGSCLFGNNVSLLSGATFTPSSNLKEAVLDIAAGDKSDKVAVGAPLELRIRLFENQTNLAPSSAVAMLFLTPGAPGTTSFPLLPTPPPCGVTPATAALQNYGIKIRMVPDANGVITGVLRVSTSIPTSWRGMPFTVEALVHADGNDIALSNKLYIEAY